MKIMLYTSGKCNIYPSIQSLCLFQSISVFGDLLWLLPIKCHISVEYASFTHVYMNKLFLLYLVTYLFITDPYCSIHLVILSSEFVSQSFKQHACLNEVVKLDVTCPTTIKHPHNQVTELRGPVR